MISEIRIDGTSLTPPAELPAIEVVVERDTERYSVAVQMRGVKLYSDAFQYLRDSVRAGKRRWVAEITIPASGQPLRLRGDIHLHEILWYEDYCEVNLDLDSNYAFAQTIGGRLIPPDLLRRVQCIVRPQVDKGTLMALAVATFIVAYVAVKEATEIIRDIRIVIGITGAGVSGPISGAATAAALLILRLALFAAIVAQLVQLIRAITDLLGQRKETWAFNLSEAVRRICNDAGFSVNTGPLDGLWIVGDTANTFTAVEVMQVARQLQNAAILVLQNSVYFVPNAGRSTFFSGRALELPYRYPSDEMPRRTLVTLLRDIAEGYALQTPSAVEIDRNGLAGFSRVDIPLAPGVAATPLSGNPILRGFLNALSLFSRRIRQVRADYNDPPPLLMVEREGFAPKLLLIANETDFTLGDQSTILQKLGDRYGQAVDIPKRYEGIRMPLSADEFVTLLYNERLKGVHSLRWRPYDGVAEITYDTKGLAVQQTIRIV